MNTPSIQAATGRARNWLNRRPQYSTGRPRPWFASARLNATTVSSPAARADAEKVLADTEKVLADLHANRRREAGPRLVVKPAKAVKPALTLPVAKTKAAPAAPKPADTKSMHLRCLEDQERRGTLRGFCRTELALIREREQRK